MFDVMARNRYRAQLVICSAVYSHLKFPLHAFILSPLYQRQETLCQ